MMKLFSGVGWRMGAILALALVSLALAVVLLSEVQHDRALAAAKKHGRVHSDPFHRVWVSLPDGKGYQAVLPLLTWVPELNRLSLGRGELSEDDLQALGRLTQLNYLHLQTDNLSNDDLQYLSTLVHLSELHLPAPAISDDGLSHLAPLDDLRVLGLPETNVHGPGLVHITPKLESLSLGGAPIDDQSVAHCLRFTRLNRLELDGTQITYTGLMKLVPLHWLHTLGTPRGITRDQLRSFRTDYYHAIDQAVAEGREVPAAEWRLSSYD